MFYWFLHKVIVGRYAFFSPIQNLMLLSICQQLLDHCVEGNTITFCVEIQSLKKMFSAGPPAGSSYSCFFPKVIISTIAPPFVALPTTYNHSHHQGHKQGNTLSPSSLCLTSKLLKVFPLPTHCLYPFPIRHLRFSLTLENLSFQ